MKSRFVGAMFAIIGFFLGNYLATVISIIGSMIPMGLSTQLVIQCFKLNKSPWAEWEGARAIVPVALPLLYLIFRYVFPTKDRILASGGLAIGLMYAFLLVTEVLLARYVTSLGVHLTLGQNLNMAMWDFLKLVIPTVIGASLGESAARWYLTNKEAAEV